jgi:hypothetical protein
VQIIGGFAKSATSIIRQLVDAGTLSNLPAGFKTRGMRILGDDTPISPGEFKDVDIPSGALKDNILPLPYKEPSAVLYQLLQTVVDEGRRMGSVADLKVADMNGQTPVGTTLAILERTLKVMSAVQSRVYHALDQELKLLADIIKDSGDEGYDIVFTDDKPHSREEDYGNVEIVPTSNPNASTMAQRVMQYQAAVQLAQQSPQIYDMANLHSQMLKALGIENVETLIPAGKEVKPMDPVSENMNLMKGTKVKAFIYQDHMAHMTIHTNLLNDPKMAQAFQNMTNGQQIQAAIQAHVMEHAAFQYRSEMEQMMGVELPKPDEEIPEEMEVKLSKLLAEASDMLLKKDQNEASQQQAQQQAQDPVIQMQQKELEIKEMEVKGKLDIEQKKIDLQERVAVLNASAKGDELAAKHAINLMGAEQAMEQMQLNQAAKEQQLALQQQQAAQQAQAQQQAQQQLPSGQPQGMKKGGEVKKPEGHIVEPTYGYRDDMTRKAQGYFGPLTPEFDKHSVMSEYSVGVPPIGGELSPKPAPLNVIDEQYVDVPSIVPTLTKDELSQVLRGEISPEVADKARKHATDRAWKGRKPFASPSEQILNYPKGSE